MIRNDDELKVAQGQLGLIEEALASLRRDVLPKNKRNYEILSEGYVDQIAVLKAEITAYTKLHEKLKRLSPAQRKIFWNQFHEESRTRELPIVEAEKPAKRPAKREQRTG